VSPSMNANIAHDPADPAWSKRGLLVPEQAPSSIGSGGGSRGKRRGRRRRRRWRRCGDRGYGGSGEDVRRLGVKDRGVKDARVGVGIRAGERHEIARGGKARFVASDAELRATGVELGAAHRRGKMERDDLVSGHVIARGKGGGHLNGRNTTIEKLILPPYVVFIFAYFLYLEPLSVDRVKLVACDISAGREVREHRSNVMRPLATIRTTPIKLKSAPRVGVEDVGGRFGAGSAVDVAIHSAFDGVGGEDLADAAGNLLASDGASFEVLAVNGHALNEAVGSHKGKENDRSNERKSESRRGLHWWVLTR
jgi:hypothetical protein